MHGVMHSEAGAPGLAVAAGLHVGGADTAFTAKLEVQETNAVLATST